MANPALVDILLIRHFKKHGGLVLPPLVAARAAQEAFEAVLQREKDEGRTWETGRSMLRYPNWRDTRGKQGTGSMGARGEAVAWRGWGRGRGRGTRGMGSGD